MHDLPSEPDIQAAAEPRQPNVTIDLLRHWATVCAYGVDNPGEAIDALCEISEGLEDVLAGDR